jgi:hypothetical protein
MTPACQCLSCRRDRWRKENYERRQAGLEPSPPSEGVADSPNPCQCERCKKMRERDIKRRAHCAHPSDDELDRRAIPWLDSHGPNQ